MFNPFKKKNKLVFIGRPSIRKTQFLYNNPNISIEVELDSKANRNFIYLCYRDSRCNDSKTIGIFDEPTDLLEIYTIADNLLCEIQDEAAALGIYRI